MYYLIVAAACITGAAALLTGLARKPARNPEEPMDPAEPTDYERILCEGGTVRVPFDSDSTLVVSIAECHFERRLRLPLSAEQEWGLLLSTQHPGRLILSWATNPEGETVPNEETGSPVYEPFDLEPEGDTPSPREEPSPEDDHNLLREVLSTRRRLLTLAPDSPPQEQP